MGWKHRPISLYLCKTLGWTNKNLITWSSCPRGVSSFYWRKLLSSLTHNKNTCQCQVKPSDNRVLIPVVLWVGRWWCKENILMKRKCRMALRFPQLESDKTFDNYYYYFHFISMEHFPQVSWVGIIFARNYKRFDMAWNTKPSAKSFCRKRAEFFNSLISWLTVI